MYLVLAGYARGGRYCTDKIREIVEKLSDQLMRTLTIVKQAYTELKHIDLLIDDWLYDWLVDCWGKYLFFYKVATLVLQYMTALVLQYDTGDFL